MIHDLIDKWKNANKLYMIFYVLCIGLVLFFLLKFTQVFVMVHYQYLVVEEKIQGETIHKVYDKNFREIPGVDINHKDQKVSLPNKKEMNLIRDYKLVRSVGDRIGLGFIERIDDVTFYMLLGGLLCSYYLSLSLQELQKKQPTRIIFDKYNWASYLGICAIVIGVYFAVEHDAPESQIAGTFFCNPGSLEGGSMILVIQRFEGILCLLFLAIGYLTWIYTQRLACILINRLQTGSNDENYCQASQYLLNSIIVSTSFPLAALIFIIGILFGLRQLELGNFSQMYSGDLSYSIPSLVGGLVFYCLPFGVIWCFVFPALKKKFKISGQFVSFEKIGWFHVIVKPKIEPSPAPLISWKKPYKKLQDLFRRIRRR